MGEPPYQHPSVPSMTYIKAVRQAIEDIVFPLMTPEQQDSINLSLDNLELSNVAYHNFVKTMFAETWEDILKRANHLLKIWREVDKKKKDKDVFKLYQSRKPVLQITNYIENVEEFYKVQPFFYDKQQMFWFWDDKQKKYVITDDTEAMLRIDKELGFQGQTVSSKVRGNYLEAFRRVGRQHIPMDAPKKWIQFKDKAFSLESGKIYDITPDYFFTNPIPHKIGDSEDTPIMDKLITEWVGAEYLETAYQILAYCCYMDYPVHLIFCFIGCGSNGKGQFMELIRRFVGNDNICSTELDTLLNSRFESFKLYKKLVCVLGETNFGILNRTSLIKKLVGKDLVGFEYKNKVPFDAHNYAKIVIASNSLPTSEDTSEGFYRRWLIIDFARQFPEGKDIIETIPQVEYENLARKVYKVLPELLQTGSFAHQGTIAERKEKYIMASNPFSKYLEEYCLRGNPEDFVRYSELYLEYRKYLHLHKRRGINHKEFNEVLLSEGFEVVRTSKRIGETWVVDRFVQFMSFIHKISTPTILREGRVEKSSINSINCINFPVEEKVQIEEKVESSPLNPKEAIMDFIKNIGDKSFTINDITDKITLEENVVEQWLLKLSKEGEIYPVKYGYWKILK